MCNVSALKESEKKIHVVLKNGNVYSSEWYLDNDSCKKEGAINCTEKEYELYQNILSSHNITEQDVKEFYISRKRENDNVYISDHAMDRLKERNGWSRKTALRMIQKVYDNGARSGEIKGHIATWVKNKESFSTKGDYYILYGQNLYIFNHNTLVTVIHAPKKHNFMAKN